MALALGEDDVDELLDRLDPEQFAEWQAYDQLEPFGEDRSDLRNAILITELGAMLAPWFGEHLLELKRRDYMPFVEVAEQDDDETGGQDPAVTFAILETLAARFRPR